MKHGMVESVRARGADGQPLRRVLRQDHLSLHQKFLGRGEDKFFTVVYVLHIVFHFHLDIYFVDECEKWNDVHHIVFDFHNKHRIQVGQNLVDNDNELPILRFRYARANVWCCNPTRSTIPQSLAALQTSMVSPARLATLWQPYCWE